MRALNASLEARRAGDRRSRQQLVQAYQRPIAAPEMDEAFSDCCGGLVEISESKRAPSQARRGDAQ